MRSTKVILLISIVFVIGFLVIRLGTNKPQPKSVYASEDSTTRYQLFASHCSTCHMLPDPAEITKDLWRTNILPLMAIRMGLQDATYERRLSEEEKEVEKKAGLIPAKPMISEEDFEKITTYILDSAPDSIPFNPQRLRGKKNILQFKRRDVAIDGRKPSLITALKFDTASKSLWIGNMYNEVINWKWKQGVLGTLQVSSPVVHFNFYNGNTFFTEIGDLLPSEISRGSVAYAVQGREMPVLSSLHRPVFAQIEDFNQDGTPEILINNFGKNLGSLSLFKGGSNGQPMEEQVLMPLPGATKTYVADMNGDGSKDIVALFAQGDESIYIFYNRGNLQFTPKRILRYPPHYGTSEFVLVDCNNDGRLDVVTAHGDNADYSIMLKPYHGIRISINEGKDVFKEVYFFPAYGVTRILFEDFDKDGDVDFAASAFYPDYDKLSHESFIYLENLDERTFRFQAYVHESLNPVKSLTLEKADIDDDGDMNIILGNFAFSPVKIPKEWEIRLKESPYGLIIFSNQLRN